MAPERTTATNGEHSFVFAQVGNADNVSYVDLVSELSLGPGTYYVVIASKETIEQGITLGVPGLSFTSAPGVTVGNRQYTNS